MKRDEEYHPFEQWDPSILIEDLMEGKIIGVVKGQAEHGPRALGHRSILCNPSIPEMKDTLNAKVKNREWYRPFAPVVRLEDVSKYFEFEGDSRWMSFCPKVREEWREKLAAITHVDFTARVQTVTKEQNDVCAYSIHQKRWVSLCEAMGSPVKKNKTFMKDSSPHPRDTGTPVKFDMTTDSQSPVKRLKTANKSSKKALTTRASRRK